MTGPRGRTVLKVAALLVLAIGLQTIFGADLRVDGVAPDFMVLLAVLGGFIGGPDTGAVVGFGAGVLADLFLQGTPFGLSALAFCLTGFAVGWVGSSLLRPHWYLVPVVAALGTAAGVAAFVVIGYLVGQAQLVAPGKVWLAEVATVEALYSAVLGLPAATAVGWALARPSAPVASPPAAMAGTVVEAPSRRRAPRRSRRRRRARAGVR